VDWHSHSIHSIFWITRVKSFKLTQFKPKTSALCSTERCILPVSPRPGMLEPMEPSLHKCSRITQIHVAIPDPSVLIMESPRARKSPGACHRARLGWRLQLQAQSGFFESPTGVRNWKEAHNKEFGPYHCRKATLQVIIIIYSRSVPRSVAALYIHMLPDNRTTLATTPF
jgi:hypothetical protein